MKRPFPSDTQRPGEKFGLKGHLYLVGFMGSGKSTVGPVLAEQLGRSFVDLDHLIEDAAKMDIPRIFDLRGEAHFRGLETRMLAEVQDRESSVVALGGGAFSQALNRDLIFKTGIAVALRIPLELAWRRSTRMDDRPLARDRQQFESLYHKRQPDYDLADLKVGVSERSPEQICRLIRDRLETMDQTPDSSCR